MKKFVERGKGVFGLSLILAMLSCGSPIKKDNSEVLVEEGTEVIEANEEVGFEEIPDSTMRNILGFWVGDFKQDGTSKEEFHGDAAYWDLTNKINISIDKIEKDSVFGHSVVAGSNRPFRGAWYVEEDQETSSECYWFEVIEPGDNKYDGAFKFVIKDSLLSGKWKAYKIVEVPKRKYELKRVDFTYNANDTLEYGVGPFVNWNKETRKTEWVDTIDGEIEKWIDEEFSTTTFVIYEVNASNTVLKKEDVENMKKEDLRIIRNTIYARHGYSFKNRPLRYFFDSQEWYVPLSTDIREELTDIEKENIKLLLSYEEHAEDYYDSFGR